MPIKFKKNCTQSCNFASSTSWCIADRRGTSLQVCTVKSDCWCNLELCVYTCTEMYFWRKVKSTEIDGYQTSCCQSSMHENTMKNACKS